MLLLANSNAFCQLSNNKSSVNDASYGNLISNTGSYRRYITAEPEQSVQKIWKWNDIFLPLRANVLRKKLTSQLKHIRLASYPTRTMLFNGISSFSFDYNLQLLKRIKFNSTLREFYTYYLYNKIFLSLSGVTSSTTQQVKNIIEKWFSVAPRRQNKLWCIY